MNYSLSWIELFSSLKDDNIVNLIKGGHNFTVTSLSGLRNINAKDIDIALHIFEILHLSTWLTESNKIARVDSKGNAIFVCGPHGRSIKRKQKTTNISNRNNSPYTTLGTSPILSVIYISPSCSGLLLFQRIVYITPRELARRISLK